LKIAETGDSASEEEKWIGALLYPVLDEQRRVLEVVCIHDDATESVRSENEIRELNANYASAASLMSVDGLAACFTDDLVYEGLLAHMGGDGDLVGGRAVAEYMGTLWATLECVTQLADAGSIKVDGDSATQTCDFVEYVKFRDTPGLVLVVGHYDDQLTRTADGWRFARRKFSARVVETINGAAAA
jgi:hypothetical protein